MNTQPTPTGSSTSVLSTLDLYTVKISIEPGQPVLLLHWALSDLRDKFVADAADEIISKNLAGYWEAVEQIGIINDLIQELTSQLNNRYRQLLNIQLGYDPDHIDQEVESFRKNKMQELAKRFKWDQ